MFRCYSVFRLVRTKSGSLQKNAVSIRKYDKPTTPYKRPTMNDVPVPSGSWKASYAKRNVQNNTLLLLGTGALGLTLTFAIKSDVINWGRGPGYPELEPREPFIQKTSFTEDTQSSSADTQETESSDKASSPVKESSKPKSEEGLHTVEVLDPVNNKENVLENKELEELQSYIETEDSEGLGSSIKTEESTSKDVVIITDDSFLVSPSSSSTDEEAGNNPSPNA